MNVSILQERKHCRITALSSLLDAFKDKKGYPYNIKHFDNQ